MRSVRTLIVIAVVAIAAVAALAPAGATASGGGDCRELNTLLHGSSAFPGASGDARFRTCGTSGRDVKVEVEDVRRLAGQRVRFFVGGTAIGTKVVNRFGQAQIERDTDDGQAVPQVQDGTVVRVRTLGGTLIASGTF